MDATLVVAVVVVALVVAAGIAGYAVQRQRSRRLQRDFGPEYSEALHSSGDRSTAESELEQRRRRVDALGIRPLSTEDAARLNARWQDVQRRFVDDSTGAVADADALVREAMELRGYPVGDFEQRAADLSVDHPHVVRRYRSAHQVAERNDRGEATTDDLRSAMLDYRTLFDDLREMQRTRREAS